jgi:hypothetical protein
LPGAFIGIQSWGGRLERARIRPGERPRDRARREPHPDRPLAQLRVRGSPSEVSEHGLARCRRLWRGLQDHALLAAARLDRACGLLEPVFTGARDEGAALIEDDLPLRARGHRGVHQHRRLFGGERVESGHEVDVVLAMREAPCIFDGAGPKEVRIGERSGHRHRLAAHAPVQERQLGIDACQRAFLTRGAGDPQRHALGQDQVKDLILEVVARDRGGDWPFDGGAVGRAFNRLVRRSVNPDDVGRRNRPLAHVVFADQLRRGAVVVDDDRNIDCRLGGDLAHGGERDEREGGQGRARDRVRHVRLCANSVLGIPC